MKKLIALLLCLVMSLSVTAAVAEDLPVITFDEANIAQIGGDWMLLEQFGLMMYVPDIFGFMEVPEEMAAQGILAVLATEDQSAGITIAYCPLLDHEGNQITNHTDLVNYYVANGYETIATCVVNGLEATNFAIYDRDMMAMVYFLADGNALCFYYTPISNESLLALHSIVSSSVMLAQ